MADKKTEELCLAELKKRGADRAKAVLKETTLEELNVERGKLSLFRTTHNADLMATAIIGERRGTYTGNHLDRASVERAADEAVALASACPPDPAYDIAERQPAEEFDFGPVEPDRDLMFERLSAFLEYASKNHPATIVGEGALSFRRERKRHLNSNGVNFTSRSGYYEFSVMFTSKKAGVTSSFNHTGGCLRDLSRPLVECGTVAESLALSGEELNHRPLAGKFDGDIVIAPDALGDFIGMFCYFYLTDMRLVDGTSVLKDSLEKTVVSSEFTLASAPLSRDLAFNYFFTQDGYKTENTVIVDRGVLKTFLLSLYGARKTGNRRAATDGGCHIVAPGSSSRDALLGSVKRGLYVRRVSGGMPNDKGDFSFIAKNSFLIEDGQLKHPVNESMISGNIFALFKNMSGISRERINFGADIYPWVKADGLVISGK
jgi:PmbA protein